MTWRPPEVSAGGSYGLPGKVFGADLIVEIEFTVLPKSEGWKAAEAEARKAKILRTIFRRKGAEVSTENLRLFPFSNYSACWPDAPTKVRFLVFLSAKEDPMGLENDEGGYSSFNPDYSELTKAVSVAARWDKDGDGKTDWATQRKISRHSKNRYLRALAVWFLQEQKAEGMTTHITKKELSDALWPVGSCGPTRR